MGPETPPQRPGAPGQIAPKPDPTHPAQFIPHDTHGPVYEQMFDFTGPRTGRPSSAPDRQQRPRKRKTAQHGTQDASRPSGHGTGPSSANRPGTAPAATERPQQIPRRNAGRQNRPQLRHGPREAPARAAKTGKPRTHGTPERLTAGQDAPRNGPQDRRPRPRNAYILLYIKHQQTIQIYSYFFCSIPSLQYSYIDI